MQHDLWCSISVRLFGAEIRPGGQPTLLIDEDWEVLILALFDFMVRLAGTHVA